MPPPLDRPTLAIGRPSAAAVRLAAARKPSATRSPRLPSRRRIGFGLPPLRNTSVVPILFAARLALGDQRLRDERLEVLVLGHVVGLGLVGGHAHRAGLRGV